MDSFIRESLRANPIGEAGLERTITSKDGFTFSNGLHVPRGVVLAAPLKAIQQDLMNYPGGFNPRRTLEDPIHPSVNHNARVSQLWVRAAGVSWPVVCSEYAETGFGAFGTGV